MKYACGNKLRAIREKRKITLKEVAQKAGVSESLISQIERNKVSPAIDTLLEIAHILDIDLEYLFSEYKTKKSVTYIPRNERNKIVLQGVTYEQLSKKVRINDQHGIEAYHMIIEVNGQSGSSEYGHIGKELGVIIEGQGILKIGNQTYHLEAGDSISFDSDVPHILINSGDIPLKAFWVITPPKMLFSEL